MFSSKLNGIDILAIIGINIGSFFTFSTIFLLLMSIAKLIYLIAISFFPSIKDILDNPKKYDYLDERLLNYTSDNNSIKKKILQLFKEQ